MARAAAERCRWRNAEGGEVGEEDEKTAVPEPGVADSLSSSESKSAASPPACATHAIHRQRNGTPLLSGCEEGPYSVACRQRGIRERTPRVPYDGIQRIVMPLRIGGGGDILIDITSVAPT